jgi:hypothetical protein
VLTTAPGLRMAKRKQAAFDDGWLSGLAEERGEARSDRMRAPWPFETTNRNRTPTVG